VQNTAFINLVQSNPTKKKYNNKEPWMSYSVRIAIRIMSGIMLVSATQFALSQSNQQASLTPACGPDKISYGVHLNDNPPLDAAPLPGKARVYFIQDGGTNSLAYPTTRMALDGQWVGANHGDSYFYISVDPGVHHVCATLQTSLMGQRVELAHFTAEAGQTYYYRTRLILSRSVELLALDLIDSDQGSYLTGTFPLSVSKPKK
jgi:hypothetical protein